MERPRDPGTSLFGVVAEDASEALFALVRSYTSPYWGTPPLRLAGLAPAAHYVVTRVPVPGEEPTGHDSRTYTPVGPLRVRGAALMTAGVQAPYLNPDQAALYHLVREG
jgi:alpha-galactosidase